MQRELNAGRVPAMQMAEGLALLFAGAVLLTPGFLTDALGFALLTPPLRRGLIAWVARKGFIQTVSPTSSRGNKSPPNIIEGEFSERE